MQQGQGLRHRHQRDRNGCLTCRKRRKKCGLQKPTCEACQRNFLACTWPEPPQKTKSELQPPRTPASSAYGQQYQFVSYAPQEEYENATEIQSPDTPYCSISETGPLSTNATEINERRHGSEAERSETPSSASHQRHISGQQTEEITSKTAVRKRKLRQTETVGLFYHFQNGHMTLSRISNVDVDKGISFHYYQSNILPGLEGHFTCNLWSKDILQIGYAEASVQYAIKAVVSCHRQFVTGKPITTSEMHEAEFETLLNYSKAIKLLHQKFRSTNPEDAHVVLTCCLLFYILECMRGRKRIAVQHVQSGLKVLKGLYGDKIQMVLHNSVKANALDCLCREMIITFYRLEMQVDAYYFVESSDHQNGDIQSYSTVPDISIPVAYESLNEARAVQIILEYEVLQLIKPNLSTMASVNETCRFSLFRLLKLWKLAYQGYLARRQGPSYEQEEAEAFVWLHYHMQFILLDAARQDGPSVKSTSAYRGLFAQIRILTRNLTSSTFTIPSGRIIFLWYAATRPMDPDIRAEARALLSSFSIREGVWDSTETAKVTALLTSSDNSRACAPFMESLEGLGYLTERFIGTAT